MFVANRRLAGSRALLVAACALVTLGPPACGGSVVDDGSANGTDASIDSSDVEASDASDSGQGDVASEEAGPACPPKNLVTPGDEYVSCCNGRPCRGKCTADGACDCFGIAGGCWQGTVCCAAGGACRGPMGCPGGPGHGE